MKFAKKLALAAALASAVTGAAWADVAVIHTNDVHCGVGKNIGIARVAQYKKDLLKDYPAVFLVDAGDFIQGEPIGKLSNGVDLIEIMNVADYDFAIPGNHEFDYGMGRFLELSKYLKCGYYSANFTDTRTDALIFKPYKIVKTDGKTIAFVGVSTPETLISSNPTFFKDDAGQYIYGFKEDETGKLLYDAVQSGVDAARKEGADFVILLGHLGQNGSIPVWSSEAVTRHTRGIDAVIDGHSHEQFTKQIPNADGKPIYVQQTGTKLKAVGQLILKDDGTVTAELLHKLPGTKEDPKVAKLITLADKRIQKHLSVVIGKSTVDFTDTLGGVWSVRHAETNLGDLVCDAVREYYHADVALMNSGGIRATIPKGTLTNQSLLNVFPFGNMMALREVSGQQILDALEMGAASFPEDSGGFFQVSGLTYTIDASVPSSVRVDDKGNFAGVAGEYRVKDVKIGGKPLDLTGDYRVAGSAYILKFGGDGMTMFQDSVLLRDEDAGDTDVLRAFIKARKGTVGKGYENPRGQGRITVINRK